MVSDFCRWTEANFDTGLGETENTDDYTEDVLACSKRKNFTPSLKRFGRCEGLWYTSLFFRMEDGNHQHKLNFTLQKHSRMRSSEAAAGTEGRLANVLPLHSWSMTLFMLEDVCTLERVSAESQEVVGSKADGGSGSRACNSYDIGLRYDLGVSLNQSGARAQWRWQ